MISFTTKLFTVVLVTIFFYPDKLLAQKLNSDSSVCLEIKGKVLNVGNKSSDTYKAELIYYNNVINNETISATKSFKFDLKRDAIYSIRISKKGFITKLISIYTRIPEDETNVYRLDFETELIEEHLSKKLDADALDFPITIIYYDEKADSFYYNEEYTNNIKRCIYNVKVVRNKI
ncbi:MAG: hypothetical protein HY062_17555 [Bacteroidetes bacterium]|nr:hypothetical protein [Bacteroidota bacterium]